MNKKELILKYLKKEGRSSSSKISYSLGINPIYCMRHLEELLAEGKIVKEEETNSTYWRLK